MKRAIRAGIACGVVLLGGINTASAQTSEDDPPPAPGDPTTIPFVEEVDTGTSETFPPPTQQWLETHCAASVSTATTTPNVIEAIVPYSGYRAEPNVSNFAAKVRDIIRAVDRGLDQSSNILSQHYRLVCQRNSLGEYDNIAVRKVEVPRSADTNANGLIGCQEADGYLRRHEVYGDSDARRVKFNDTSINTGGPYAGFCFYGTSDALGNTSPGITNPNNSVPGFASVDADSWPRGATNYVTAGVMQEIGHSIGLVGEGAPGGVSSGYGAYHTRDFPDFMNAGYFKPGCTDVAGCGNVRLNCFPVPTTFTNTYVDCGRDTYWDPTPESTEWLCNHYNLATDSLYFSPLAIRPPACPPA